MTERNNLIDEFLEEFPGYGFIATADDEEILNFNVKHALNNNMAAAFVINYMRKWMKERKE